MAVGFNAVEVVEFPKSQDAWALRLQCELNLEQYADANKSLQSLIETKDPKDPHYDSLIDSVSSFLKSVN